MVALAVIGFCGAGRMKSGIVIAEEWRLEEITKAFQERTASVGGVELTWTQTADHPATVGLSFECRFRLAFDGSRVRIEERGESTDEFGHGVVPIDSVRVSTDGRRVNLYNPGTVQFPNANITTNTYDSLMYSVSLLPINSWLWPLDPKIGPFRGGSLRVDPQPGYLEGKKCALITGKATDHKCEMWCDPELEFVPILVRIWDDRSALFTCNLHYTTDSTGKALLSKWKTVRHLGTVNRVFAEAIVTMFEPNREFEDKTFTVSFPTGTWIKDYVGDKTSILRSDGTLRPVLPGEFNGKNYETLAKSPDTHNMTWYLLFALNFIVMGIVLGLLWGRKRRRTTSL